MLRSSGTSVLHSDMTFLISRSITGGIQHQPQYSTVLQPNSLWLVSVLLSVSTSSTTCGCSPSLWCHDRWSANNAEKEHSESEREWERRSDLSSDFLSLCFIMKITSFTPSTFPFVSYCQRPDLFSVCNSGERVCVIMQEARRNRDKATRLTHAGVFAQAEGTLPTI